MLYLRYDVQQPSRNPKAYWVETWQHRKLNIEFGYIPRFSHGSSYYDAARICVLLKDMRAALSWTEKEIEVDLYCLGADHPEYRQGFAVLAQMKIALETTKPIDASIAR